MILLFTEGVKYYDETPKQDFEISVLLNIIKFYRNNLTIKVYVVFVLNEM